MGIFRASAFRTAQNCTGFSTTRSFRHRLSGLLVLLSLSRVLVLSSVFYRFAYNIIQDRGYCLSFYLQGHAEVSELADDQHESALVSSGYCAYFAEPPSVTVGPMIPDMGTSLYLLVSEKVPEPLARKITGIYLEKGSSEVHRMLTSPRVLAENIDEVLVVLRSHHLLQQGCPLNHPMLDAKVRKYMCGLRLRSLVAPKVPIRWISKVIGMFLELDSCELYNMLEFTAELDERIEEALSLLRAREESAAITICRFFRMKCSGNVDSGKFKG